MRIKPAYFIEMMKEIEEKRRAVGNAREWNAVAGHYFPLRQQDMGDWTRSK
jgi:hypothetical protein